MGSPRHNLLCILRRMCSGTHPVHTSETVNAQAHCKTWNKPWTHFNNHPQHFAKELLLHLALWVCGRAEPRHRSNPRIARSRYSKQQRKRNLVGKSLSRDLVTSTSKQFLCYHPRQRQPRSAWLLQKNQWKNGLIKWIIEARWVQNNFFQTEYNPQMWDPL